ncbi:alpha-amylase-like [Gigantopelta aegis]|uniref:alpha-amylase-like n=1 Tax=Gigantopelta aegis TaxID=1735272 RepID=UPI001B88981A|nr:alpha-amylase-like [Gigantopelta aegis]
MDSRLFVCFCLLVVTRAEDFQRTLVVIYKQTVPSEYLFLRGGDAEGNGIPIWQIVEPEKESSKFRKLSEGDTMLDWHGREEGQPKEAFGTPLMWTTNNQSYHLQTNKDGAGYFNINIAKGHMWIADLDMDCDKTHDGWFQYKGFITQNGKPKYESNTYDGWEQVRGGSVCEGELLPDGENFKSGFEWADPQNHFGKCGSFNFVSWGNGTFCFIHSIEFIESLAPPESSEVEDETEK